jgi:hypothetical protein
MIVLERLERIQVYLTEIGVSEAMKQKEEEVLGLSAVFKKWSEWYEMFYQGAYGEGSEIDETGSRAMVNIPKVL